MQLLAGRQAAAKLAATLPATPQVEQATAAPKCAADGGAEEDQPKTAEPGKAGRMRKPFLQHAGPRIQGPIAWTLTVEAFSPAAVEPSFADIVAGRPARLCPFLEFACRCPLHSQVARE